MEDRSQGWENVAHDFIAQASRSRIGAAALRRWAGSFPEGATILDLACGPGGPRSEALARPGLTRYALDAAPTLAAAYQQRYPDAIVACEAAERSSYFGRQFDGILAWGLLFLLPEESQRALIPRLASALLPGGRLLFTAPHQAGDWADRSTGRRSVSLGYDAYAALVRQSGLTLTGTETDEGSNHYYHATRPR